MSRLALGNNGTEQGFCKINDRPMIPVGWASSQSIKWNGQDAGRHQIVFHPIRPHNQGCALLMTGSGLSLRRRQAAAISGFASHT